MDVGEEGEGAWWVRSRWYRDEEVVTKRSTAGKGLVEGMWIAGSVGGRCGCVERRER